MNGSDEVPTFGRSSAPATRFHNRIVPPAVLDGWAVRVENYPQSIPPVMREQGWTLARDTKPVFLAVVAEYPSAHDAQHAAWSNTNSVSAPIERSPTTKGPGDYAISNIVARDNVYVSGGWPGHVLAATRRTLGGVDAYLLTNWPQEAARKQPQPLIPLSITLTAASTVKQGESTRLGVVVLAEGRPLSLFDLSFRVLADPGTVVLKDGGLWFSSTYPGKATITLDAVRISPHAAYGQTSMVIQVRP